MANEETFEPVVPKSVAGKEYASEKNKRRRIQIFVNSFSKGSNRKERRRAAAYFAKQLKHVDI